MATVNKSASLTKRVFIGHCWINTVKKDGANQGKTFLNLKIDRGTNITLAENDAIQLWPNVKREGKVDADYSASIQVPA